MATPANMPKIMQDAEPQYREPLIRDGTVTQLFNEIWNRRETSEVLEQLRDEQILDAISRPSKCHTKEGTVANALSFAIHYERYSIVLQMLQVLKRVNRTEPIAATDEEGNNALQKLIWTVENRSMLTSNVIEQVKDSMKLILSFDIGAAVLKNRNSVGQTALTQAMLCDHVDFKLWLFVELMDSFQSDEAKVAAIKEPLSIHCVKEGGGEGKSNHSPGCVVGYNLLMLALKGPILDHVYHIVQIVDTASDEEKQEIILGDFDYCNRGPNSIRVAAHSGKWTALENILNSLSAGHNLANVLLSEDERLESAMKWILRTKATFVLRTLLSIQDSKLKQDLEEAWQETYPRSMFMELEMSVEAIKEFYSAGLFKDSYLLPKPCRDEGISRPLAMICYNTFKHDTGGKLGTLKNAEEGALEIQEALLALGWPLCAENLVTGWSSQMLTVKIEAKLLTEGKDASVFLLCITTHGKDEKVTGERPDHQEKFDLKAINRIIDMVVKNLDPMIPKVLIIDVCRIEKDTRPDPIVLRDNNVLLLLGTSYGQGATGGRYLKALAKEIQKADGATTMEKMHLRAAETVKGRKVQPEQIPQKMGTSRDIILRNWKRNRVSCSMHAEPGDCLQCDRCHKTVCSLFANIDSDNEIFVHPNVIRLCDRCLREFRSI